MRTVLLAVSFFFVSFSAQATIESGLYTGVDRQFRDCTLEVMSYSKPEAKVRVSGLTEELTISYEPTFDANDRPTYDYSKMEGTITQDEERFFRLEVTLGEDLKTPSEYQLTTFRSYYDGLLTEDVRVCKRLSLTRENEK